MPRLKSPLHQQLPSRFNLKSIVLLSAMLFALCALPLPVADAAQVTLGWDSNPEPDLEGYVIYCNVGSPGPPYDYSDILLEDDLADPLHPTATLPGLQEGNEYYIALTAFNTDGDESSFSNDICVEVINGAIQACSASSPIDASAASSVSSSGGSGGGGAACFISSAAGDSGYNPVMAGIAIIMLLVVSRLLSVAKAKQLTTNNGLQTGFLNWTQINTDIHRLKNNFYKLTKKSA